MKPKILFTRLNFVQFLFEAIDLVEKGIVFIVAAFQLTTIK